MAEVIDPGTPNLRSRLRNSLLQRVYLAGYSGTSPPRWLRRCLARSDWHRAWLLGFTGCFTEDKVAFGPAGAYPDRTPRNMIAPENSLEQ